MAAITPIRRGEATPKSDDFLKEVYSIGAGEPRRVTHPSSTLVLFAFEPRRPALFSGPRPKCCWFQRAWLKRSAIFAQPARARYMHEAESTRDSNFLGNLGNLENSHILCGFLAEINKLTFNDHSDPPRLASSDRLATGLVLVPFLSAASILRGPVPGDPLNHHVEVGTT